MVCRRATGWLCRSDGFCFGEGLVRQKARQEGTPKRQHLGALLSLPPLALLPNIADRVQKKRSGSSTQRRRRLVDTSASLGILMTSQGLSFLRRNRSHSGTRTINALSKALTKRGTIRSSSPAPVHSLTTPLGSNETYSLRTSSPSCRYSLATSSPGTSPSSWPRITCTSRS